MLALPWSVCAGFRAGQARPGAHGGGLGRHAVHRCAGCPGPPRQRCGREEPSAEAQVALQLPVPRLLSGLRTAAQLATANGTCRVATRSVVGSHCLDNPAPPHPPIHLITSPCRGRHPRGAPHQADSSCLPEGRPHGEPPGQPAGEPASQAARPARPASLGSQHQRARRWKPLPLLGVSCLLSGAAREPAAPLTLIAPVPAACDRQLACTRAILSPTFDITPQPVRALRLVATLVLCAACGLLSPAPARRTLSCRGTASSRAHACSAASCSRCSLMPGWCGLSC